MRFAAALSLAALLACTGNSASHRVIDEILEDRAPHLTDGDRREIAKALVRTEAQTGIDPLLLLSLIEEESHYDPGARSRRGALGLMQVRPVTGREVAERHQIAWEGQDSLLEPATNILIGATYLHDLRARFGSWDLALTAYNRGPSKTSTLAGRDRAPSSRYAARVMRRLEALREESTQ